MWKQQNVNLAFANLFLHCETKNTLLVSFINGLSSLNNIQNNKNENKKYYLYNHIIWK